MTGNYDENSNHLVEKHEMVITVLGVLAANHFHHLVKMVWKQAIHNVTDFDPVEFDGFRLEMRPNNPVLIRVSTQSDGV